MSHQAAAAEDKIFVCGESRGIWTSQQLSSSRRVGAVARSREIDIPDRVRQQRANIEMIAANSTDYKTQFVIADTR